MLLEVLAASFRRKSEFFEVLQQWTLVLRGDEEVNELVFECSWLSLCISTTAQQAPPEAILILGVHYRILVKRLSTDFDSLVQRVLLKTFQKRSVSSPAPVTMASPSGDTARYKTL